MCEEDNPEYYYNPTEHEMDRDADIEESMKYGECITCHRVKCECDDPACALGW